jgi:hypothetical protein
MKLILQCKQITGLLLMLIVVCLLASCASTGSSSTTSDQSQAQTRNSDPQQTAKKPVDVAPVTTVKNGKTLVILPVTFKPGIRMHDVVRDECLLPQKLSGFVRDNTLSQYENIIVDGSRASSRADVLNIEIIDLRASKGGGWSGPKFVSIKGSLKRNGRIIGDFQGRRTSMGGAFGVFKGTCAILGRCTKTLATDIATWLQNPGKNSFLGE